MKIIVGILMIAIGAAIFLFGIMCDEYTSFRETLEGEILTIPGYGNTVLILAALGGILAQFLAGKIFGVTQYSYVTGYLIACAIALKVGFVTLPLLFETLIALLIGLELLLPAALFARISDLMGTMPVAVGFLVLVVIVAFRINSNNLN